MRLRSTGLILISLVLFTALIGLSRPFPTLADGETATPQPTFSTTPIAPNVIGTVSSGTAGVTVPAGLPVTLHIFHPDAAGKLTETVTQTMPLAPDNTFSFAKNSALPGDLAFVTMTFENATQGSTIAQFTDGQTEITLPVILYAETNDPSVISLIRVQHIIEPQPQKVLQILATYTFKNTGDRLYLSKEQTSTGKPISVKIPLPVGARAILFNNQTLQQTRFVIGGDLNFPVVQDTKAVLPGQTHEIIFSYQIPYSEGAPIDQDYPYNTASLEVLIPSDSSIKLVSDRFGSTINTTINATRPYVQYTLTAPLKAGDRLIYVLAGDATPVVLVKTPTTTTSSPVGIIILVAGIFATIWVVRASMRRFIRERPAHKPPPRKL